MFAEVVPAAFGVLTRVSTLLTAAALLAGCLRMLATQPITDIDMLGFHLPGAARFIQTGTLWRVDQFLPGFATAQYRNDGDYLLVSAILPWRDLAVRALRAAAVLRVHVSAASGPAAIAIESLPLGGGWGSGSRSAGRPDDPDGMSVDTAARIASEARTGVPRVSTPNTAGSSSANRSALVSRTENASRRGAPDRYPYRLRTTIDAAPSAAASVGRKYATPAR